MPTENDFVLFDEMYYGSPYPISFRDACNKFLAEHSHLDVDADAFEHLYLER